MESQDQLKESVSVFKIDCTIRTLSTKLIHESPTLTKLVNNNPIHPIILDIDIKTFDCIVESLRNGKAYTIPEDEIDIVTKYVSDKNTVLVPQSEFIIVRVGDKCFSTTVQTLTVANYFDSFIDRNEVPAEIYIDRNGKSFRHILKYMRNPKYTIPQKYLYEDGFYGIFDKFSKSHNYWMDNKETICEYLPLNNSTSADIYLSGNPQITFNRAVYQRHTNFSRNSKQVFGVNIDLKIITYDIDIGHIINGMFVHFVPTDIIYDIRDLKIDQIELMTEDNFVIDSNSWHFIQMNLDLFNLKLKEKHLSYLEKNELYIPLFFNINNSSLGLPMLAIGSKLKLKISLENELSDKYKSRLVYRYNNLDTEEERRFRQVNHEYLYQVPSNLVVDFNYYNAEILLPFSGPIKWIIFKINPGSNCNQYSDLLIKADLYVNDKLHMQTDPLMSFEDFMTCCAELSVNDKYNMYSNQHTNFKILSRRENKIKNNFSNYYVMPFCLNMMEHQPSGSLSITSEDKLKLCIQTSCESGKIYVVSMAYQVLRLYGGNLVFAQNNTKPEIIANHVHVPGQWNLNGEPEI